MELRVLKYFLAVAEAESITGAAEALHLSQPTLSRQLKDMEEDLGKKLLVRGTRKVTLTEEGVLLRQRAREILEMVDETEHIIRHSDSNITGTIHIGAMETSTFHLLAETATRVQHQNPGIQFQLSSGDGRILLEKLYHGSLDFGIAFDSVSPAEFDTLQSPKTEQWGAILRTDSPLAQKDSISPKDLADISLWIPRADSSLPRIARWLGIPKEKVKLAGTYSILYNALLMISAGAGCAIGLNHFDIDLEASNLCFRPLANSEPFYPTLVWKKNHPLSKAAELFLHEVQKDVAAISTKD